MSRQTAPHPAFRRVATAVLSLVIALVANVASAPTALADAAGPTDYRTDVVAVEPSTPAFAVEMIGGDAFLRLEQVEPVEIVVLGYQGEPYLRFDRDGTVYENRRSPAVWLNQERYGNDDPPSFADPEARPEWAPVADGGTYAWHDHRSHWMTSQRPPGASPGDQILEATVPLDVDGQRVVVTVASYLLESPSPLPAILGGVLGIALVYPAWRGGRSGVALVTLLASGAAALLGMVAFRSVPTETQPSPLLWLLPVVSLVAILVAVLVRRRVLTTVYLDGLAVIGGAMLTWWGISRFDALRRALIPSDAPGWLDRTVIAVALVVGAAAVLRGVLGLLRPARLRPAPLEVPT